MKKQQLGERANSSQFNEVPIAPLTVRIFPQSYPQKLWISADPTRPSKNGHEPWDEGSHMLRAVHASS